MRDIVVVFARAPRLGAVKRRLARGIGARPALRFYLATLGATLRGLRADGRFRLVLAVTPDRSAARWPVRVPLIPQGRGDLGMRMHRACNRFRRRRVVLIGSDIPELRPTDVAAAVRALGRADAVFGPALDGGYWLVGMSPRRPAKPFSGVRWSSEHALADTLANFRGRRVALLRTLRDVDTAADFHAVRKATPCRAKAQPSARIHPRGTRSMRPLPTGGPALRLRLTQQLRVRRIRRLPLVSPRLWLRRVLFWCGAVLVALVAIAFARAADGAQLLFREAIAFGARIGVGHLLIFVLTPVGLMVSVLLTMRVFPGAQGSGIPQVIAAMHMRDQRMIGAVLSARIAIGKILLTLLGLASGASIGREGPTVQVGASIMFALGRLLRLPRLELQRSLVLAGGAAGISAAFNTPLAGVVFAIEELAHSFEARTSGMTLTAVVIAGITTLALVGNYAYFGVTSVDLAFGPGWLAVLACGVVGGLAGGVFSYLLTIAVYGRPRWLGRFVLRHPLGFAAACGVLLAVFGWASGGATCGTGYAQARQILAGTDELSGFFPFLKLAATVVSYLSGIPGGIFSPSLAVGAGLGGWLSQILPGASPAAVVLLGMVGYFSGVVQAPITAAVIVMEMTDNRAMTIPLLATALLAFGMSRLVARRPLYSALAERFLAAVERRAS